jgi:hypothetical protein
MSTTNPDTPGFLRSFTLPEQLFLLPPNLQLLLLQPPAFLGNSSPLLGQLLLLLLFKQLLGIALLLLFIEDLLLQLLLAGQVLCFLLTA